MTLAFNRNQNTPLTCVYLCGIENATSTRYGTLANIAVDTGNPHAIGNTLTASGSASGSATFSTVDFITLVEAVVTFASFLPLGDPAATTSVGVDVRTTTTPQTKMNIFRGVLTTRLGSAGTLSNQLYMNNEPNHWQYWHWWVQVHDSTGHSKVYQQHYENQLATYSGDTKDSATAGFNRVGVTLSTSCRLDDLAVWGRTMYYTGGAGGSGAPVVGNTLSQGGGAATAKIDVVYDTAGAGVVFVSTISGSFTTGGGAISDGSGWTATASNNLANDKASLWVPEYVIPSVVPTGDVTAGWTSTGANQWSVVDDVATTSDYISTTTTGTVTEVSLGNTGAAITGILAIQPSAYAQQFTTGTANSLTLGYDDGGTNVDADNTTGTVASGAYAFYRWIWTYNTNGAAAAWTTGEIDALNARITSAA